MNAELALLTVPRRPRADDVAGRGPRDAPAFIPSPLRRALTLLGDPWKPLIVWHLFWGPRPFGELMRRSEGITKRTLRRELVEMERGGLVRRTMRFRSRRRAEYSLTPYGETLKPVVATMYEWGLRTRGDPCAAVSGAEIEARPPRPAASRVE